MTREQTTVEIVEELLPQAVLDEQEAYRKERTYKNIEEETDIEMMNERSKEEIPTEKEERLETLESRDDDDNVF